MESPLKKVLIAIDGSETTGELVDYLSGIISARHAELVLFHVMPKAPESFWTGKKSRLTYQMRSISKYGKSNGKNRFAILCAISGAGSR